MINCITNNNLYVNFLDIMISWGGFTGGAEVTETADFAVSVDSAVPG